MWFLSRQSPWVCSVSRMWGMDILICVYSPRKGPLTQGTEFMSWMQMLLLKPISYTFFSRKEISKILRSSYLRGMNLASFFVASKIIVGHLYHLRPPWQRVITASRVFVAVSLYGAVRLTVTLFSSLRCREGVRSIRQHPKNQGLLTHNFIML